MPESIAPWLFDPFVGRRVSAFVGLFLVVAVVRLLQRSTARMIKDADVRYRTRKSIGFLGYALALLIVLTIFSDRLGQLTVAFGVAGAGIAFAVEI